MEKTQKVCKNRKNVILLTLCVLLLISLIGCGNSSGSGRSPQSSAEGQRSAVPEVLTPTSPMTNVIGKDGKVSIDISNVSQGYVTVLYSGDNNKVKLQIASSGQEPYTYDLKTGSADVFPLNSGDGTYAFTVFENISGEEYSTLFSGEAQVVLEDQFLPFLYPNQYVKFTASSAAIAQGQQLAEGASSDLDVVERVYNYAINNITYDVPKATSVESGYLPDVDETLRTKTGICFDYAALMTAMLRSQRIPTRLVIGYVSGEDLGGQQIYHAWISVYIEGQGWIDNIIYFDGKQWGMLDPTLASSTGKKESYKGDGNQYNAMYYY